MEKLFEKLDELVADRKSVQKDLEKWTDKLEYSLSLLEDLEEARSIFQKASQITQSQLAEKVSSIVSSALAAVFEDPYTFVVDFVSRRNTTECDLYFMRNGKRRSPLSSCGYGASDIASLGLRVAYWKLDSDSRNVLCLDEPLRNLSLDKQPLASMMIKELSKMEGGLQFLVVTHNIALAEAADAHFEITKTNDISNVRRVL